jgi:4-diphosphocytidyl-2-C-methyl-D-erythritol kinase
MPLTAEITMVAPAKINLCLRVLARRPDGYHELETLMQKVELADRIHLRLGVEGIRLVCSGADLPCDEGNLVYRAARDFLRAVGSEQGVDVDLEKRIPVAAGLGGGSSDAAAVLKGLNILLGTGFSEERLREFGKALGADVPFFVSEHPAAWATGIGDILQPAATLGDCWIVLANPGFAVSTKWVYENFALTTGGNPYKLGRVPRHSGCVSPGSGVCGGHFCNDLEFVTLARHPEVGVMKEELLACGATAAMMSGSGPTVFGIFHDAKQAVASQNTMLSRHGGQVFLTRPLQA